jgi:hypothetical protein
LFGGRQTLTVASVHLTFLEHVHEFDSAQGDAGRTEAYEPKHGSDDPLDGPMSLFNQVVQVLVLTDLDFVTGFFDERFNGGSIGSASIEGDFFRKTVMSGTHPLIL